MIAADTRSGSRPGAAQAAFTGEVREGAWVEPGWALLALVFVLLARLPSVPLAQAGIETTVHNLSVPNPSIGLPGGEGNVCIFCHIPHNANPSRALWNREQSLEVSQLYESSTLEAALEQPTGASRLCLSCHDGTLALGAIRETGGGPAPSAGPLTGRTVLGTDLSDDHPISFLYDVTLAARRGDLVSPDLLPSHVKLDQSGQLQCTSCHDPHTDRFPQFLVADPRFGDLCLACHRPDRWLSSTHALSPATWNGTPPDPWPDSEFQTVAENACENCHTPHSAPSGPRLLRSDVEEDVCLVCHNGAVAAKDIEGEFLKFSRHPVDVAAGVHDPVEDPLTMTLHVECVDCHNPHATNPDPGIAPAVSGALAGVSGITATGTLIAEAQFQYEVCFKCHGVSNALAPRIERQDTVTDLRLAFDLANPSYHPVEGPGRNPTIVGLEPPLTPGSIIYCTDCHSSEDGPGAGGSGPAGPHGSNFEPLLEREYRQEGQQVQESFASYALCYKCHNRSAVLTDQPFKHREHIVEEKSSCAICHDPHGSRQNPALINFMLRDDTGQPIVQPSSSGALSFQPLGADSGRCFLTCHGEDHDPKGYGPLGKEE